jgi:ABC-2 type transport system permease protein
MVLGKVLGGAAIAMIQGLIFLVLGGLSSLVSGSAIVSTSPLALVAAVILMAVIAVALTALGFTIAWRMDSTQGFHAIMSVFLLPMWLLSGAFFPLSAGGWIGWIVRANPLTYGVAGLRHYLQNGAGEAADELPAAWICWLVSLAFAGLMLAAAWRIARTRSTGDLL